MPVINNTVGLEATGPYTSSPRLLECVAFQKKQEPGYSSIGYMVRLYSIFTLENKEKCMLQIEVYTIYGRVLQYVKFHLDAYWNQFFNDVPCNTLVISTVLLIKYCQKWNFFIRCHCHKLSVNYNPICIQNHFIL